jgi:hypothetical protein
LQKDIKKSTIDSTEQMFLGKPLAIEHHHNSKLRLFICPNAH